MSAKNDANQSSALELTVDACVLFAQVPNAYDEDVHRFTGTFGAVTAGTWALYFDGSDVGLTAAADDLGAITFDGADMLFSTFGTNTTPGSDSEDINRFSGSFGSSTSGTATLELDLSTLGIDPLANVNGVHV